MALDMTYAREVFRSALVVFRQQLRLPVECELSVHIRDPITGDVIAVGPFFTTNTNVVSPRANDTCSVVSLPVRPRSPDAPLVLSKPDDVILQTVIDSQPLTVDRLKTSSSDDVVPQSSVNTVDNNLPSVSNDTAFVANGSGDPIPFTHSNSAVQTADSLINAAPIALNATPVVTYGLGNAAKPYNSAVSTADSLINAVPIASSAIPVVNAATPYISSTVSHYNGIASVADVSASSQTFVSKPVNLQVHSVEVANTDMSLNIRNISFNVDAVTGRYVMRSGVRTFFYSNQFPQMNKWSPILDNLLDLYFGGNIYNFNCCIIRRLNPNQYVKAELYDYVNIVSGRPSTYHTLDGNDGMVIDTGNRTTYPLFKDDMVLLPVDFLHLYPVGTQSPYRRTIVQFMCIDSVGNLATVGSTKNSMGVKNTKTLNSKNPDVNSTNTLVRGMAGRDGLKPVAQKSDVKTSDNSNVKRTSETKVQPNVRDEESEKLSEEFYRTLGTRIYEYLTSVKKHELITTLNNKIKGLNFVIDVNGSIRNQKEKIHTARLRWYDRKYNLFTDDEKRMLIAKARPSSVQSDASNSDDDEPVVNIIITPASDVSDGSDNAQSSGTTSDSALSVTPDTAPLSKTKSLSLDASFDVLKPQPRINWANECCKKPYNIICPEDDRISYEECIAIDKALMETSAGQDIDEYVRQHTTHSI